MEKLTKLVAFFYKIKGIEYAYTQVKIMIQEELDFTKEAKAMQIVRENLKDEFLLTIPEVHEEFSTQRVLTTTFCKGIKISDTATLDEWNIDRKDLGNRLVHVYCQMVFTDGLYHADPHPGNILIQNLSLIHISEPTRPY